MLGVAVDAISMYFIMFVLSHDLLQRDKGGVSKQANSEVF